MSSALYITHFLVLLTIFTSLRRSRNKFKNLPPSPPSIPILGHLHLLTNPIHHCFANLSKNYGPIYFLKLGSIPTVVVSSPSAIEECFTKNDVVLANRPPFLIGKYFYDFTIVGTASYGDHWRNVRRICATEIFSSTRLNTFRSARREEVNLVIRRLHRACLNPSLEGFAKVELRSMFMDLNMNIIMRIVSGKRYFGKDMLVVSVPSRENIVDGAEWGKRVKEVLYEFFDCPITNLLSDFFPVLQCVDYDGFLKRLMRISIRMDCLLQELIEEQRQESDANTMISRLLALQETNPNDYSDETIKGLVLALLVGGSETTSLTLEWAMANMVAHSNVKSKATQEMDTQIGEDHLVDESDLPKLTYLRNIINETFRLHPVIPLLLPHFASDHCTIGGYEVPCGSMVIANVWEAHRDAKYWDGPTRFEPERFEKGVPEGQRLLPFGMGRRACPGEALAHKVLGLTLGSLVQCFEWESVEGEMVDMSEKSDVSLAKAQPLQVLCKPRPFLNKILQEI